MDGGILSQDEINALLNGMGTSDDGAPIVPDELIPPVAEGNKEIPKDYLSGSVPMTDVDDVESLLSDVEKDAIGEVANISMGTSATTLYSLVNRKVNITTPVVSLARWEDLIQQYEEPCVFIQIKYTKGLDGSNILVLRETDVKIITDLMMGGDGTNIEGEIGELHLSAISEAMNQMMGSSATSLSTMLDTFIDISPPTSSLFDVKKNLQGNEVASFLGGVFVKIAFRMQIGDLVDSSIMQLYPVDFAKKLVDTFVNSQMDGAAEEPAPAPAPEQQPQQGAFGMDSQMGMNMGMGQMGMNPMGMDMGMNPMGMNMGMGQMGMNPMGMNMGMGQMGMNPMGMNMGMGQMGMNPMGMNMGMGQMGMNPQQANIDIQPAQFQNFSQDISSMQGQENIGLIMDVPLEVTVELGRTSKSISDILNFAPGTIIELDRIAGEPIDVLVNGKFVAKGEVVVIEESFGVRVTEIIK